MAKFSLIKVRNLPAKPLTPGAQRTAILQESFDHQIEALSPNKAGVATPDKGETARSVQTRVYHAARRVDVSVDSWIVEDTVYFILAN